MITDKFEDLLNLFHRSSIKYSIPDKTPYKKFKQIFDAEKLNLPILPSLIIEELMMHESLFKL